MIVHHGSLQAVVVPEYGKGESKHDYGQGFYTTESEELANEWAVYRKEQIDGYRHTFSIATDELNILYLNKEDPLHWLAELVFHRHNGLNRVQEINRQRLVQKYRLDTDDVDIIIGRRADDSYFRIARDYLSGALRTDLLTEALNYGELGDQVFIKSPMAFNRIKHQGVKPVPCGIFFDMAEKRDALGRERYTALLNSDRNIFSVNDTIFGVIEGGN